MIRLFSILIIALMVGFVSCKEDDDPKAGISSSGTWTARLNGTAWAAGKIEKKVTNSGEQFNAYGNTDNSVMVVSFEGVTKVNDYIIGQPSGNGMGLSYYSDVNKSSTLEDATEGRMTITKYTTDSLVATYNFKSSTRQFTEGVIKIKLN